MPPFRSDIQTQNHLTVTVLNSHLLSTCPSATLETSPPAPLGVTNVTQAPPVALPTPATWSTALTSALQAPASEDPPSIVASRRTAVSLLRVRLPLWSPALVRCPATIQGLPHCAVPAGQLTLCLWALVPADAAP